MRKRSWCLNNTCLVGSAEEVFKLLLEKNFGLLGVEDFDGSTLLHKWILSDDLWPVEFMIKSLNDFPDAPEYKRFLARLSYACDPKDNNIFHLLAEKQKPELCRKLAEFYREAKERELASLEPESEHELQQLPWLLPNKNGKSALEIAMRSNKTACDEYDLLKTDVSLMESIVKSESELLLVAIDKRLLHAAEKIWYMHRFYGWWGLYPPEGQEIWHAALEFSEEVIIWMMERLPSSTSTRDEIQHVLRSASEVGAARSIEFILKKDPSLLKLAPMVWVEACKRGHFSAVMAFIDHCPYFREICLQQKDTPLHYIKFDGYMQCLTFLKDPIILALKNLQDGNGKTPLHKSIENRNLLLTEVLLTTDDVIRSIEDNDHNTPMDLLVQACKESQEWDEMCKRIGIVPRLKTTYFQDRTDMLEVRNTLSVVAALLATITFTAGFTLPGGVQSDSSGKPTLGNKAAFLLFLLADALAMCCSMLVLVCLLWSMLCDHNRSLLLIDKSMPVLLVALYSTLVAFMMGVYVVIPHKSLWSATIVVGMCSIAIILSKRWIMYKLLDMLNPVMDRKNNDELSQMEQGEATTMQRHRSSWIQERACSCIAGSSQRQQKSE